MYGVQCGKKSVMVGREECDGMGCGRRESEGVTGGRTE